MDLILMVEHYALMRRKADSGSRILTPDEVSVSTSFGHLHRSQHSESGYKYISILTDLYGTQKQFTNDRAFGPKKGSVLIREQSLFGTLLKI